MKRLARLDFLALPIPLPRNAWRWLAVAALVLAWPLLQQF